MGLHAQPPLHPIGGDLQWRKLCNEAVCFGICKRHPTTSNVRFKLLTNPMVVLQAQPVLHPKGAGEHGCWGNQHAMGPARPLSHSLHSLRDRHPQPWRRLPHHQVPLFLSFLPSHILTHALLHAGSPLVMTCQTQAGNWLQLAECEQD